MAELQEKIATKFPEATFTEGDVLMVNIPDAQLHSLVKSLRDDFGYDYLITIVGMDWQTSTI